MKTLIIDDDEHIARTLAIKLEDLGFDVHTASTVAQAKDAKYSVPISI